MNIEDGMGHKGRGSFKRAVYYSSIKVLWSYILSNLTETLKKIKILGDDRDRPLMKYTYIKRFDPAIIIVTFGVPKTHKISRTSLRSIVSPREIPTLSSGKYLKLIFISLARCLISVMSNLGDTLSVSKNMSVCTSLPDSRSPLAKRQAALWILVAIIYGKI